MARQRPDLSVGIELVLTSEWEPYRWGPVASRDRVRSLIDKDGYFWGNNDLVHEHVKVEEAEIELRAQIERALQAGLRPSHFINHMGSLYCSKRPDLRALYVKLARDYRLPARGTFFSRQIASVLYYMGSNGKGEKLLEILRDLKPGLWELYPHCAVDSEEIRAITHESCFVPNDKDSWRGRVSDTEIYTDLKLKQAIADMGIELVSWRQMKDRLDRVSAEEFTKYAA
jgi:predicted glycoside hydrolase/deacetylase ChbG (UPF0249 family)